MKKVFKILRLILFLFLFVFSVSSAFNYYYSKGGIVRTPSILGYKPLTILSNSMQPTFSAGDLVLINVNKEPHVNEVITYKHPHGILVTHRLVGIVKKDGKVFYQSKGDNNNVADDVLIPRSSILGVEQFVIPNVGFVAKFIAGPIGFFLLIVLPILALIIIEIFQRLGLIGEKEHRRKTNLREGRRMKT